VFHSAGAREQCADASASTRRYSAICREGKRGRLFLFAEQGWRTLLHLQFAKRFATALSEDRKRRAKKANRPERGRTGGEALGRSRIAPLYQQRQQVRCRSLSAQANWHDRYFKAPAHREYSRRPPWTERPGL